MEPVVAAAEEGERRKEEPEARLDRVEAGGKLQEADEIQGAGNEEINGEQNGVFEDAKDFGGSEDSEQAIEGEEGRTDEVIEESEKIEEPENKKEQVEGDEVIDEAEKIDEKESLEGKTQQEVIEEAEKIEGPEDEKESVEKHRAADDVIDELKDVKDGDDQVGAEIEETGKAVFREDAKQGEVLDVEAEIPSKEVAGGVIRQELESEQVEDEPTMDSAVAGDEIEEDVREDAVAQPGNEPKQAEAGNVVSDSDSNRSKILGLAFRFLPNVQNLDSWASGVAFGIVTTCSIVVLWEKYSSRRKA